MLRALPCPQWSLLDTYLSEIENDRFIAVLQVYTTLEYFNGGSAYYKTKYC